MRMRTEMNFTGKNVIRKYAGSPGKNEKGEKNCFKEG